MSKTSELEKIKSLIQAGNKSPYKVLFYVGSMFLLLDYSGNLEDITALDAGDLLSLYPDTTVKAFNLNPVWNPVTLSYEEDPFYKSLPECLRRAGNLNVMQCQDVERAKHYIDLSQRGEFTGFISMVDVGYEGDRCTQPGVFYVDVKE